MIPIHPKMYFVCQLMAVEEAQEQVTVECMLSGDIMEPEPFLDPYDQNVFNTMLGIVARMKLLELYRYNKKQQKMPKSIVASLLSLAERKLVVADIELVLRSVLNNYTGLELKVKKYSDSQSERWELVSTNSRLQLYFCVGLKEDGLLYFSNMENYQGQKVNSITALKTILTLALESFLIDWVYVESCCIFGPRQVLLSENEIKIFKKEIITISKQDIDSFCRDACFVDQVERLLLKYMHS
jgi:hypothetical protein